MRQDAAVTLLFAGIAAYAWCVLVALRWTVDTAKLLLAGG
jgi:hypothetical protein